MKLLNKEELSWEDKQQVSEVLEKQKKQEKSIDDISEKNKQSSFAWLKAICAGWRSNQAAKHTQNHSSVIFVLKKGK